MLDPEDLRTIEFIKKTSDLKILPRLTTPDGIKNVLHQYQKTLEAEFGDIIKKEAIGIKLVKDKDMMTDEEQKELKKMAEELGVNSITIDHAYLPVTPKKEAMKWLPLDPKYHRYDPAELEKKWQALEKEQDTAPESVNQQTTAGTQEIRNENDAGQNDYKRRVNCSWLWTQATINWDGSVAPCCAVYDQSFDFDNISGTLFKKAWNNEKYRASRRFSSKGETGKVMTVCMQCPLAKHDL